ncbi:MAG: hypothetical protein A2Y03_02160 [Omnitrophica WOR_2 bacterium GWF2_38_59]|nr:MAG: hypothetical protein A2Y03_02160 [Omnitrophica WOR_2 bacterium GWF2_38_59]OGX47784.1 MAG: hypothetical protein A2243_00575 [Omnitrophica WOR_2 bacterium RIFOXYA2_FULL_38_17]OGX51184.1 MAG: hypothetical protein A2267_05480 [Omnitrophica WOR_2 bacterium RIFOXYA12_FULL_38_10]OGX56035.1 MAG: hypothetical protein A2306_00230 [Omnitrophica WOR_2 bacterium RIFOXYB2_FULL_38_16]OGX56939.1 MAG: hypothetical protein A2447_05470 [Omnitrophica WOR_2 bacterium RIFOXYC2_FULL_38_12]
MKESIIYYSLKIFGFIVRILPLWLSLLIGKFIGIVAYYFDAKHKGQAYANLKMAFADSKSPYEIRNITKELFLNYGQNFIELFRMPLMNSKRFEKYVSVEGKENIENSLKEGKGLILLAMHFGSWEMASLSCAMLQFPYKVMVKPQPKYSKLDDLLNTYRSCGGSVVLSRGAGTRDFVKSIKKNEVVGMVVDQGGRDGMLVPFFGRPASMSVGAIRLGLKLGVPICFAVVIRQKGAYHKMIIDKPLDLVDTGDTEKDVFESLSKVTKKMEGFICKYPSEYMWFYKIWKYSNKTNIAILFDGKTGHLRQSETVAKMVQKALAERDVEATSQIISVNFKGKYPARLFSLLTVFLHSFIYQGRLDFLNWFLTQESFDEIMSVKADFFISCGSSIAGLNSLVSKDHNAKSIVVLKPGLLRFNRFDLVVLPQHDEPEKKDLKARMAITKAAPNLITKEYLAEQSALLEKRYSHLKENVRVKIGLFVGGDSNNVFISENQIRVLINQIKNVAKDLKASLLVTTSRRTPSRIEQMLYRELKKNIVCPLLIIANQDNVPEAVGGILGLSDIVVVSGDSISMISEAASSGKKTIVFLPETRAKFLKIYNKHKLIVEILNEQGYILSTDVKNIGNSILGVAKNKLQTRAINDNKIILEAVREIV